MGWLYRHITEGTKTIDLLKEELGENLEIVESSIKSGEAYLAIRNPKTQEVFGCVVLFHRASRDYHNFGTKWIDDTMGPYQHNCPLKVLKALTPTTNECAKDWRERCLTALSYKARNKGVDLTGKRVSLWGKTYKVVAKHPNGRAWQAYGEEDGVLYKLTQKAIQNLTIIENNEVKEKVCE